MNSKDQFIITYRDSAKKASELSGLNWKFLLAQAALESGWGKIAPGNNFHGIKAGIGWSGKTQLITTTEKSKYPDLKFPVIISITKQPNGLYKYKVKDWFRAYDTPEEGFNDHAQFFYRNKRYKKALEFKDGPERFIEEIRIAGYATDENYISLLKWIYNYINTHEPLLNETTK